MLSPRDHHADSSHSGKFHSHGTKVYGGGQRPASSQKEFDIAKERAVAFRRGRITGDKLQGKIPPRDAPDEHFMRRGQLLGDPLTKPKLGGLGPKADKSKFKFDKVEENQRREEIFASRGDLRPRPATTHEAMVQDPLNPKDSEPHLEFEFEKRVMYQQKIEERRQKARDAAAAAERGDGHKPEDMRQHLELSKSEEEEYLAAVAAKRAAYEQSVAQQMFAPPPAPEPVAEPEAEAEEEEAPGLHSKYGNMYGDEEEMFQYGHPMGPYSHFGPHGPPRGPYGAPAGYHGTGPYGPYGTPTAPYGTPYQFAAGKGQPTFTPYGYGVGPGMAMPGLPPHQMVQQQMDDYAEEEQEPNEEMRQPRKAAPKTKGGASQSRGPSSFDPQASYVSMQNAQAAASGYGAMPPGMYGTPYGPGYGYGPSY